MTLSNNKERSSMFRKEYRTTTKAEVIEQYGEDYEAFLAAFSQFPEKHYDDQILNNWGIKEILAHMAGWDLETIKAIQAAQKGELPWFFDSENKVDTFNLEQVEKRKFISIPEVLAEMEVNHKKLIGFLEQFPKHLWHQGFGNMWHQQDVTPSLVCSYRHYAAHRQDILKYLEKLQK